MTFGQSSSNLSVRISGNQLERDKEFDDLEVDRMLNEP